MKLSQENPRRDGPSSLDYWDVLLAIFFNINLRLFLTYYFQHIYVELRSLSESPFHGIEQIKQHTDAKLIRDKVVEQEIISNMVHEWTESNMHVDKVPDAVRGSALDYLRYANEETFKNSKMQVIPKIKEYINNRKSDFDEPKENTNSV